MNSPKGSFSVTEYKQLFTPKLLTVLREGYSRSHLRRDFFSGLTVAVVALPLSMAIAIASGAKPEQGLIAAIVGGLLISALGGSRFQIGGPAGAFIVLVSLCIERHGMDGFLLATFLSGFMLAAIGLLKLGTYIKFIPYPVTVGFTTGIALVIFVSQLSELLGLGAVHSELMEKSLGLEFLQLTWLHLNPSAVSLSLLTIACILLCKRLAPAYPSMLIALIVASLVTDVWDLQVETIGSRFGGIPRSIPLPSFPTVSLHAVYAVFPDALAFTLLGGIESLLSAVVADGMTGRRHRSNCELVAQGFANIAVAIFGGMCVTGTIARTVTNVRAGAHSPLSGVFHALLLLFFVLVAAPLASHIPLAALASILVLVAWNMIERQVLLALLTGSKGDALVTFATLFLTVFVGLTEAIFVGVAFGTIQFLDSMAKSTMVNDYGALVPTDVPDSLPRSGVSSTQLRPDDSDTIVYRVSGVFFFGSASTVSAALDSIAAPRRNFVIDFSSVPFIDSTAANSLVGVVRKARNAGRRIIFTGMKEPAKSMLRQHGVSQSEVEFYETIDEALAAVRLG